MDAPIAAMREKAAEANAQVTDLRAEHADLLAQAQRAQFAIDSAQREADAFAAAVTTLEATQPVTEGDAPEA